MVMDMTFLESQVYKNRISYELGALSGQLEGMGDTKELV